MMVNVAAALRLLGGWKFGTPLLTASTPVRAVQPDENARRTSATSNRPLTWWSAWMANPADSAVECHPRRR